MPESRSQWIEGVRPVIEALRAGRRRLLEIELPERDRTPGQRELRELAAESGVPILPAPNRVVRARAEPYLEESLEDLLASPGPRRWVALERVTDVGNLGSIARSAEAAGFSALILEYRRAPPIRSGALRASAGALEHLRVGRTPKLRRGLELARSEGVAILVAQAGEPPLDSVPPRLLRGDLIWVFGSEDRGISPTIRNLADRAVGLPMRGQVASLGVAAAAAILLHQTAALQSLEPPS